MKQGTHPVSRQDSSGPSPRASSRATDKKRHILLAASALFRQQGLHATSMRNIAEKAGMQVGNLYYYFENKEELLAFCQEEALDGLLQNAAQVRARNLRPDSQLFLMVSGHVVRLNEGTPGSLAHLEVEVLTDPRRQAIVERRDAYESTFRQVLSEGIECGVFRPTDPKVATMAILGALNWTVKWYLPEGGKSAREIGEEFGRILVRGLLAPGVALDVPTDVAAPLADS